jgi:hypothetical protein
MKLGFVVEGQDILQGTASPKKSLLRQRKRPIRPSVGKAMDLHGYIVPQPPSACQEISKKFPLYIRAFSKPLCAKRRIGIIF